MLPEVRLTPHEERVLRASVNFDAGNDLEIGEVLGMKPQTVKNARWIAYRKLGVSGRNARWEAARKLGWL